MITTHATRPDQPPPTRPDQAPPSATRTLGRVFFQTWYLVIVGTVACAAIVSSIFLMFGIPVGAAVGIAIGPIVGLVNVIATRVWFYPLRSAETYGRYTRGLCYGLVAITIGPAAIWLVGAQLAELTEPAAYEPSLWPALYAVAYSAYCLAGCGLIARWTGNQLATRYAAGPRSRR